MLQPLLALADLQGELQQEGRLFLRLGSLLAGQGQLGMLASPSLGLNAPSRRADLCLPTRRNIMYLRELVMALGSNRAQWAGVHMSRH